MKQSLTIGIPVYNNFKDLQLCLKSIRENVSVSLIQLIIVDDNSKENIKAFLRKIIQDKPLGNIQQIMYIKNQENRGFPHNANIILDEATHDIICILNSDTYVCEGALEKMIQMLQENETVLVAGPSTSQANSPQMVIKNRFVTEEEIKNFGKAIEQKFTNDVALFSKTDEKGSIGGFCYGVKKSNTELIGYFDEIFGRGNFEESDYNARVDFLGYKQAWIKGAYVHHFGQRSFKTSLSQKISYYINFWKNYMIYIFKKKHYTEENIKNSIRNQRNDTKEILYQK